MRKLLILLMSVLLGTSAWAATVTLTMSDLTFSSPESGELTATASPYSLTALKNSGGTNPAYNTNGADLRVYAKGTLTVETSGTAFTSIVINLSTQGKKRLAPITANNGTIATQAEGDATVTWTGNSTSVTFTVGDKANYGSDGSDKAGQLCLSSMVITEADAQSKPDAPTFDPPSGTESTTAIQVTMSCATAGATIRYATEGFEPTLASPSGTIVTFSEVGTHTLKAIAVKNGIASDVATATYTITDDGSSTTVAEGDYVLVTDVDDLAEGDRLIIATAGTVGEAYAISTAEKANNREITDVAVVKKGAYYVITPSEQVEVYELTGSTGAWSFMATGETYNGQYLAATGTKSTGANHLKYLSNYNSEQTQASISIASDGVATIVFNTDATYPNVMRYNSSSSLISCYTSTAASGQKDVYLFKASSGEAEYTTVNGIAEFKQAPAGETVRLFLAEEANARVLHVSAGAEAGTTDAYVRDNSGAILMKGLKPSRDLAYNQHLAGWIIGKFDTDGETGTPLFTVDNELTNTDYLVIADAVTEATTAPTEVTVDALGEHLADWVSVSDVRIGTDNITLEGVNAYEGALVDVSGIVTGATSLQPTAQDDEPAWFIVVNPTKDFVLPASNQQDVNVLWKRSLTAGLWTPITVPMDIDDFDGEILEYVDLVEGEPMDGNTEVGNMVFRPTDHMEAGLPYLVNANADMEYVLVSGTTLRNGDPVPQRRTINGPVAWSGGPRRALANNNVYSFAGVFTPTTMHDDYNTIKVMDSNGNWSNALDVELNGTDAYLLTPSYQGVRLVLEGDGTELATAVHDIRVDKPSARAQGIYNLMGVKMQCEWDQLPAGIYIVNGKKAIKH